MWNIFAEVRGEERRNTYAALLTLFGIMAAHALLETARDTLFLTQLPASRLPWVYLSIAGLSLVFFALQLRTGRGASSRPRLVGWLLLASVITLSLWFLAVDRSPWVLYVLYTWSGVLASLVVVRFWTLLGELFTVSQAKRLYALIGVGSVLGAITGSGLARLMVDSLDPRHLILAASGMLVATALGPVLIFPRMDSGPHRASAGMQMRGRDLLRPVRTVWSRPYLRRIAAILVLSAVTLTQVDFIFKSTASSNIEPERLGSFFAGAYLAFNILSLLAQVFLVSWLVRALGVNGVLSVLPTLVIFGALGVAAGLGLAAAFVLKSFDGGLRHSLHRTVTEVLYVPLTAELRTRVKGLIDVLGQRGGQALASLSILLVVGVAGEGAERVLAVVTLILSAVWIGVARTVRSHYLELFRETLSEVSVQSRFDFPELDLASLETLIGALNSTNDSEVLATLSLLAEQDRAHLIPALILYHPSPRVVIRALELFVQAGRDDYVPITDRLLEHSDPDVRAATLRARAWVAPSAELFERFLSDSSSVVRTTALIGVISYGSVRAGEAREEVRRIAETGTAAERLALARAIRYSPGAEYNEVLLALAQGKETRVKQAVVLAMGETLSPRFVAPLIAMLPERRLRGPARSTLVAMGSPALDHLDSALSDFTLGWRIRRQLPRTIGQFRSQEAVDVLLRHFPTEPDGGVRYRILRTLGRLKSEDPLLQIDEIIIKDTIRETMEQVYWLLGVDDQLRRAARAVTSRATPVQGLILELLQHKRELALERLFRLLDLLFPGEDLQTIYRGLRSQDRKVRSSSLELLEDLLAPPLKDPFLAVVDDVTPAEMLRRAGSFRTSLPSGYEDLIRGLLRRGGMGMRALVAYHAGELRLTSLVDDLKQIPPDEQGLVTQVVDRALAMISTSAAREGTDGK